MLQPLPPSQMVSEIGSDGEYNSVRASGHGERATDLSIVPKLKAVSTRNLIMESSLISSGAIQSLMSALRRSGWGSERVDPIVKVSWPMSPA